MTIFEVPRQYPSPLRWDDRVRNGKEPDYRTPSAIARRLHFALAHQRKLVFMRSTSAASPPQSIGGTTTPWYWTFRTGENTESGSTIRLRAKALMLPAGNGSATDPRFVLNIGGLTSEVGRYSFIDTSPSYDQLALVEVVTTALAPDTVYSCSLDVIDFARVVSLTCYEEVVSGADTAAASVTDRSQFSVGSEVTDAQHQELATDTHEIWKHCGAHLLSLTPDTAAGVWTSTATGLENMLDNTASTTVGPHTPGHNFLGTYKNPQHTDNLACVLFVYGNSTNDTDGQIILKDSGGNLASITNFDTTAEWKSTTFNLDGSLSAHKADFQFQAVSGGETLKIFACDVYEYVA